MPAPTNTVTTLNSIGQRENLGDIIYRVVPEKTPVWSAARKTTAKARRHEWQTESLASAAVNAQLEGDDIGTPTAGNLTSRISNIAQIFRKDGVVSRTVQEVDQAGRADELARQKVLKGIEMRRDIELSLCSNSASRLESGSDARLSAGLRAWITTNSSYGAGGSAGGFNTSTSIVDAATPGTNRTFTEAIFKTALQSCFDNSGEMKNRTAYMSSSLKATASTFTGIADIRKDAGKGMATIVGAAEVYVSDFGDVTMVPHAYACTNTCLILDPEMYGWATLDGVKSVELAKTGDADKFMLTTEGLSVMQNQRAHAAVLAVA